MSTGYVRTAKRVRSLMTPHELAAALGYYTNSERYLYKCQAMRKRIGLDGSDAGSVTPRQAALATIKLKSLGNAKVASRVKAPEGPRRLSLADLKAMAQVRKQSATVEFGDVQEAC